MDTNFTTITPFTQTTTQTINKFKIKISSVELFSSVSIIVECFDASNNFLCVKSVVLEGTEYTGWLNDDTYIINKVKEKLGFA